MKNIIDQNRIPEIKHEGRASVNWSAEPPYVGCVNNMEILKNHLFNISENSTTLDDKYWYKYETNYGYDQKKIGAIYKELLKLTLNNVDLTDPGSDRHELIHVANHQLMDVSLSLPWQSQTLSVDSKLRKKFGNTLDKSVYTLSNNFAHIAVLMSHVDESLAELNELWNPVNLAVVDKNKINLFWMFNRSQAWIDRCMSTNHEFSVFNLNTADEHDVGWLLLLGGVNGISNEDNQLINWEYYARKGGFDDNIFLLNETTKPYVIDGVMNLICELIDNPIEFHKKTFTNNSVSCLQNKFNDLRRIQLNNLRELNIVSDGEVGITQERKEFFEK